MRPYMTLEEEDEAFTAFIFEELPDVDVKPAKSFGEMKAKALKNIPIERDLLS